MSVRLCMCVKLSHVSMHVWLRVYTWVSMHVFVCVCVRVHAGVCLAAARQLLLYGGNKAALPWRRVLCVFREAHVIDDGGKREAREMRYRKKTPGKQRRNVWRERKEREKAAEAGCGG